MFWIEKTRMQMRFRLSKKIKIYPDGSEIFSVRTCLFCECPRLNNSECTINLFAFFLQDP